MCIRDRNIVINKNGLFIKTANNTIVITYLQMPNKNVISSSDAFNAYKDYFNEWFNFGRSLLIRVKEV